MNPIEINLILGPLDAFYGQRGWPVYDLEHRKIFTSHDVTFYEDKFPFAPHTRNTLEPSATEKPSSGAGPLRNPCVEESVHKLLESGPSPQLSLMGNSPLSAACKCTPPMRSASPGGTS